MRFIEFMLSNKNIGRSKIPCEMIHIHEIARIVRKVVTESRDTKRNKEKDSLRVFNLPKFHPSNSMELLFRSLGNA